MHSIRSAKTRGNCFTLDAENSHLEYVIGFEISTNPGLVLETKLDMGIHGLRPFKLSLLALLVISGLHCSREPSKNDGTQNTGGGNVVNSSKAQVNESLDLALKLATEPDMTKNVFVQFWKDWGQSNQNGLIAKPIHLFTRAETSAKSGNEVSANEHFESPVLLAMAKNKIVRADSDCKPSSSSPHTYK